jgi:hypothetical protein
MIILKAHSFAFMIKKRTLRFIINNYNIAPNLVKMDEDLIFKYGEWNDVQNKLQLSHRVDSYLFHWFTDGLEWREGILGSLTR